MSEGRYALLTGSGKDAALALHHARAEGLDVRTAASLYDAASGRIAFHGTPVDLVEAQHRALGLDPLVRAVGQEGFEAAFRSLLETLVADGVTGVVLGNIHLEDIRAWYGRHLGAYGLEHVEPLWGRPPSELVREVVDLGYRARVVSVMLGAGDPAWLGRDLGRELIREIEESGADPCGEHGEYHTFVYDGPAFAHPVEHVVGSARELKGHRFVTLSLAQDSAARQQ